MVEDVCPLAGAGRNWPYPLLPLAAHGEVEKPLPVARLATKKLLVSVDAVVALELFSTILTAKHMATVLQNCVLVRRLQRLESLVTDITGVNHLFFVCFVPPH